MEDHPELEKSVREAFDSEGVTRHAFGQGLANILGQNCVAALDADQRTQAELLLFTEGTRRLRRRLVQMLVLEGLEVRGDEGWLQSIPSVGDSVTYVSDLPAFYRDCEINLNVTSIQMPTAVNQRVFDCPAAGGFLLTDAQSALASLFDLDEEVVAYSSLDECSGALPVLQRTSRVPTGHRAPRAAAHPGRTHVRTSAASHR